MSGHSKWSTIKHKKGAADQKRGKLFGKLLKAISVAARENNDPSANPRLRSAIEKARENNVPRDNIERAINKTKETDALKEITLEAYGPEGSAFIIVTITDNSNRTISEIKKLLSDNEGKLAEKGSVLWSFSYAHGMWTPSFTQTPSEKGKEKVQKLYELLADHDDVQEVVTNT